MNSVSRVFTQNAPIIPMNPKKPSAEVQLLQLPSRRRTPQIHGEPRVRQEHGLTIRMAEKDDVTSMAKLLGTVCPIIPTNTTQVAATQAQMTQPRSILRHKQITQEVIADPAAHTFVAAAKREIIGLAAFRATERPQSLRRTLATELGHFHVQPEWSDRGVGSQLMREVLQRAVAVGNNILWLRVGQGNQRAIHFYRRWGFNIISASSDTVGSTLIPVWIMVWNLHRLDPKMA